MSFNWLPEADKAFERLKVLFSTASVLIPTYPSKRFVIEEDTSDVGAVLFEYSSPNNWLQPCAFYSRRFSSTELNYDMGNRELLVVKLALEEWRHLLEGAKQSFVVWTDHMNLAYIQSAKTVTPNLFITVDQSTLDNFTAAQGGGWTAR